MVRSDAGALIHRDGRDGAGAAGARSTRCTAEDGLGGGRRGRAGGRARAARAAGHLPGRGPRVAVPGPGDGRRHGGRRPRARRDRRGRAARAPAAGASAAASPRGWARTWRSACARGARPGAATTRPRSWPGSSCAARRRRSTRSTIRACRPPTATTAASGAPASSCGRPRSPSIPCAWRARRSAAGELDARGRRPRARGLLRLALRRARGRRALRHRAPARLKLGEPAALAAVRVEVPGVEPGLEGGPRGRPFAVQQGVPGRVAARTLDDHVLARHALEGEAEPLRRPARADVGGIALPLDAPVAQVLEGVAQEEVDGLGRRGRALEAGPEPDVPDLQAAVGGLDAQVGDEPTRASAGRFDDRQEERVVRARPVLEPGAELAGGEGPVGQEAPEVGVGAGTLRGREEGVGVRGRIDGDEFDATAGERPPPRRTRPRPRGQVAGARRARPRPSRSAAAGSSQRVGEQHDDRERQDPPGRDRARGDQRGQADRDDDAEGDAPVVADDEVPRPGRPGPQAAHAPPPAVPRPRARRPAGRHGASARRTPSETRSSRHDHEQRGVGARPAAPAPSAPQNVPNEVSITPTANFSVFSGTRASGARTATPAAATTRIAARRRARRAGCGAGWRRR